MDYYDKNGEQIKAGDTIQHENGDIEKVYKCGDNDLGVNATNPKSNVFALEECYPLSEFDMNEWEIIERKEK